MRNHVLKAVFILTLACCAAGFIAAQNSAALEEDILDMRDMVLLSSGTFTIGQDAQAYPAVRGVEAFYLNRYETTYYQWYQIRIWAELQGYYFANPGQAGASGRRAAAPTSETMDLPVTTITWYDAIVWCNAASEYYGLTPCYTYDGEVLRDSEDTAACDLATCDWYASGYRLPTEAEWEYAARKIDNKDRYQNGALASGEDTVTTQDMVAWTSDNAQACHIVGTAGTAPGTVQPKGSGNANFSGLYDMSGNVLEYCWDWMGSYNAVSSSGRVTGPKFGDARVSRGGSWSLFTPFAAAGDRYSYDPNECYNYMGFRFARSLVLTH